MSSSFFALAYLRFWLLLRQKLGLISIAAGIGLLAMSLFTARVSFVNPEKIFWDFALAVMFVLQMALAVYLGTQTFGDERNRRTLHLVLSAGISRGSWIVANVFGLWLALTLMLAFWFVLSLATSWLVFGSAPFHMSLQVVILTAAEVMVVLFMGVLCSLVVRPLLALAAGASLVMALHSVSTLEGILADPNIGRFVDQGGAQILLKVTRLLPPLEWFDLKPFVGYQDSISWMLVGSTLLLGILWSFVLALIAILKFDRMDL